MYSTIANYLSVLELGELQVFKSMGVVPLFTSANGSPEYVTLKEALDRKLISVTEIDQSGSVPELKAKNSSGQFILLLDGEELIGAKQNRVLNTSILLKGKSETIIPVSCTEQGRWAYESPAFAHSDTMMSFRSRVLKSHSVTESLNSEQSYVSDQYRVWNAISYLQGATGTLSSTGALHDVYKAKSDELKEYAQAFEPVPHQQGSLVFIDGAVAGFDVVSREDAYKEIHLQLVKSYAMDALLVTKEQAQTSSIPAAKAFLRESIECKSTRFDSTGLGQDFRFEGSSMIGSALVYNESVIHVNFLRMDENEKSAYTSARRLRQRFRRR